MENADVNLLSKVLDVNNALMGTMGQEQMIKLVASLVIMNVVQRGLLVKYVTKQMAPVLAKEAGGAMPVIENANSATEELVIRQEPLNTCT